MPSSTRTELGGGLIGLSVGAAGGFFEVSSLTSVEDPDGLRFHVGGVHRGVRGDER